MSAIALVSIGAIAVIVLAALFVWRRYREPERMLRRRLSKLCNDMLSHVYLPDEVGGEIYINHLLMTAHGILLLDIRDAQGTIFSGTQLNEWSARQPQAAISFDNPLPALRDACQAVNRIVASAPVHMRVLFHDDAVFAKGRPDEVTTLQALGDEFPPADGAQPAEQWSADWSALKAAVTTD